jgi:two-component system response regulator HydG
MKNSSGIKNILIVDDEKNHRLVLRLNLADLGFQIVEAENGFEALSIIEDNCFDLILLDIKMDVMDGLSFLARIREMGNDTPVVMISAFDSAKYAVESLKLGAVDYLTKPVDIDQLKKIILNFTKKEASVSDIQLDYKFDGIYSERGLGKIVNLLKMVAPTDATVLIIGESGTGKELIAKSIHENSPRKKGPFIAVNCAALNENIIESELFGHEKGAFTGAVAQKKGKFELANGGTIFLDEIGEMPLSTQVKLLRVIQEKCIERVGGEKSIKIDVRIVAATNRDLKKMVDNGDFREDLYFRLNVFPVKVPPLRERIDELPLLIDFFIKKYAPKIGKVIRGYSDSFFNKLKIYSFPGNIRELENIVERSIILSNDDILDGSVLPDFMEKVASESELDIRNNEKNLILKALAEAKYNKTRAAEILGISRRTLHNKIKEYNLEV